MPLSRFDNLSQEKRQRLLAHATGEFAEKGFEAASLNEILASVGIGKSSYYYYFEDKEDLFGACLVDVVSRFAAELPPFSFESLDERSFWPTVDAYFRDVIHRAEKHRRGLTLFRELPRMRQRLDGRMRELTSGWMTPVVRVLRKGQALGCIRDDLDPQRLFAVAIAADAALDESFFVSSERMTTKKLEAHAAMVLELWKRIVLPAPSPTRKGHR